MNEVEVVVTRLAAGPAAVQAAAALLSHAERLRAARFVFDRDRRRFILARARLRQLLAARLGGGGESGGGGGGIRPDAVEFAYGARAKPALAGRFADADLHFNVSHCDDVAVYALSGREVGIDVEAVRVIDDADDIATRFFSAREVDAYRALDAGDKPLGFVNCWTRKEAFVKALGHGLFMPLQDFDVTLAPGEPARILRANNVPGAQSGWSLASFSPAPGFVAAVVATQGNATFAFATAADPSGRAGAGVHVAATAPRDQARA
ncbi:MAG TPA: 4'-phosphopantetheinyl transferase superfamily protein [Gemmatimonadales bacterium]|nr:4'-phosphopantetheinyl transferase superfamily protein [Gemmatimonadales bacterium]